MTEAEWLPCTDPERMWEFLRGKASDRKMGLFACACCRLVWHLLADERSRKAVEVAERFADGHATQEDLEAARQAGAAAWSATWAGPEEFDPARDAAWAACAAASDAVSGLASAAAAGWDVDRGTRADLLRDVFNAWLPPVDPAWLAWDGGTVPKLARALYDERDFGRLPVLADALEEAGCHDADLLGHCAGRGPTSAAAGWWTLSWACPEPPGRNPCAGVRGPRRSDFVGGTVEMDDMRRLQRPGFLRATALQVFLCAMLVRCPENRDSLTPNWDDDGTQPAVADRYDRGAARPRYPKSRAGLSGEVKLQRLDPKTIQLSYTLHDARTHAWWFRFPIADMTIRYWDAKGELISEGEGKLVLPEGFTRGSLNAAHVELDLSPPDKAETLSVVIDAYRIETAKTVIPKQ